MHSLICHFCEVYGKIKAQIPICIGFDVINLDLGASRRLCDKAFWVFFSSEIKFLFFWLFLRAHVLDRVLKVVDWLTWSFPRFFFGFFGAVHSLIILHDNSINPSNTSINNKSFGSIQEMGLPRYGLALGIDQRSRILKSQFIRQTGSLATGV